MYCRSCGEKLEDNVKFCAKCGTKVLSESEKNETQQKDNFVCGGNEKIIAQFGKNGDIGALRGILTDRTVYLQGSCKKRDGKEEKIDIQTHPKAIKRIQLQAMGKSISLWKTILGVHFGFLFVVVFILTSEWFIQDIYPYKWWSESNYPYYKNIVTDEDIDKIEESIDVLKRDFSKVSEAVEKYEEMMEEIENNGIEGVLTVEAYGCPEAPTNVDDIEKFDITRKEGSFWVPSSYAFGDMNDTDGYGSVYVNASQAIVAYIPRLMDDSIIERYDEYKSFFDPISVFDAGKYQYGNLKYFSEWNFISYYNYVCNYEGYSYNVSLEQNIKNDHIIDNYDCYDAYQKFIRENKTSITLWDELFKAKNECISFKEYLESRLSSAEDLLARYQRVRLKMAVGTIVSCILIVVAFISLLLICRPKYFVVEWEQADVQRLVMPTNNYRIADLKKFVSEVSHIKKQMKGEDKKKEKAIVTPSTAEAQNADTLYKYSELLKNGMISQEEYDAIKKKVLGL